ncbi:hypothetical protein [Oscillatoria nigro-viridis]|uniref:hypothetical protein n=1 Tax=Phormidium nigroviride TaxID=482564 RepID=UPI000317A1A1|nr:hypothetical protein [Oscillatoria nigro-viridis]
MKRPTRNRIRKNSPITTLRIENSIEIAVKQSGNRKISPHSGIISILKINRESANMKV